MSQLAITKSRLVCRTADDRPLRQLLRETVTNEQNLVEWRLSQPELWSNAVTSEQEDVLTIKELAVYLKISKSTLYKLAQEGRLPGQKVGKHWRFRKATIDRWLEENLPSMKQERPGR